MSLIDKFKNNKVSKNTDQQSDSIYQYVADVIERYFINIFNADYQPNCKDLSDGVMSDVTNFRLFGNRKHYRLAVLQDEDLKEQYEKYAVELATLAETKNTLDKKIFEAEKDLVKKSGLELDMLPNGSYAFEFDPTIASDGKPLIRGFYGPEQLDRYLKDNKEKYEAVIDEKNNQLKEKNSYTLSYEENDVIRNYERVLKAKEVFKENDKILNPLIKEYKRVKARWHEKYQAFEQDSEPIRQSLDTISREIVELRYAELYMNTYPIFKANSKMPNVTFEVLFQKVYKDYARYNDFNSLKDVFKNGYDKAIQCVDIASEIHTELNKDRKKSGNWEIVRDKKMLGKYKDAETLPNNLMRLREKVLVQDTANTKFEDLSLNKKLEEYRKACFLCDALENFRAHKSKEELIHQVYDYLPNLEKAKAVNLIKKSINCIETNKWDIDSLDPDLIQQIKKTKH